MAVIENEEVKEIVLSPEEELSQSFIKGIRDELCASERIADIEYISLKQEEFDKIIDSRIEGKPNMKYLAIGLVREQIYAIALEQHAGMEDENLYVMWHYSAFKILELLKIAVGILP